MASIMNRGRWLALCAAFVAAPGFAALPVGALAPGFSTQASIGGTVYTFSLAEAEKNGPVVLYFYPAAFTKGCTVEAHEFADATDEFKALGATVIGVSHDTIETLNPFSVSECRSKFGVAADPDQAIMKSYDAILAARPEYANRTSYLIGPDGHILFEYTALDPSLHVRNTMDALKAYRALHPDK